MRPRQVQLSGRDAGGAGRPSEQASRRLRAAPCAARRLRETRCRSARAPRGRRGLSREDDQGAGPQPPEAAQALVPPGHTAPAPRGVQQSGAGGGGGGRVLRLSLRLRRAPHAPPFGRPGRRRARADPFGPGERA